MNRSRVLCAAASLLALGLWLVTGTASAQLLGGLGAPVGFSPFGGPQSPAMIVFPGRAGAVTGQNAPAGYINGSGQLANPKGGLFPGKIFSGGGGLGPYSGFGLPGLPGSQNALNGAGPTYDTRTNNSMQPVLTMYNGQTSTLQVQDFQWHPVNTQFIQGPGGQTIFVPQYQPIPNGLNLAVQATSTPDGRFNRLNIGQTQSNLGLGPYFDNVAFLTPLFQEGAQGQPVPFDAPLNQPTLTPTQINTTVIVPVGGQAFMGGFKKQFESRSEFGTPILGKMSPYIMKPFNNTHWGRDTNRIAIPAPKVNVVAPGLLDEPD